MFSTCFITCHLALLRQCESLSKGRAFVFVNIFFSPNKTSFSPVIGQTHVYTTISVKKLCDLAKWWSAYIGGLCIFTREVIERTHYILYVCSLKPLSVAFLLLLQDFWLKFFYNRVWRKVFPPF